MKQVWRDINGYEGIYRISYLGNIKRVDNRIYKQFTITKNGYSVVTLSKNNKIKTWLVHRLVAITFIPNPENKPCIDHINGCRTDNRAENLRWVTHKENSNNPISVERSRIFATEKMKKKEIREKYSVSLKGIKRPKHIIEKHCKPILCLETNIIYGSAKEAGEKIGISAGNITSACKGKFKTSGGYHWRYLESK